MSEIREQGKHTPGPWKFSIGDSFSDTDFIIAQDCPDEGDSWVIIRCQPGPTRSLEHEQADFEFIVRAVNCHKELLEALKETKAELLTLTKGESCDHSVGICWCSTFRSLEFAEAAIAKAEGR